MVRALAAVLASEGMSGRFYRANETEASAVPVRFLLRHAGVRDEAIVNAYGVGAQIITLAAVPPFDCAPPQKFDRIVQGAHLLYVFDAVIPRTVGDVLIAYTAYVRGKGA